MSIKIDDLITDDEITEHREQVEDLIHGVHNKYFHRHYLQKEAGFKPFRDIPIHVLNLYDLKNVPRRETNVKTDNSRGFRDYLVKSDENESESKPDTDKKTKTNKTDRVPSVTSVLGFLPHFWLEKWQRENFSSKQELEDYLLYVSRIGEAVHYQSIDYMIKYWAIPEVKEFIHQDVPDFVYELTKDELVIFQSFMEPAARLFRHFAYAYQNRIKILDVETFVYDKIHLLAGRFDFRFLYYEDGKWIKCIGDIKTSKAVYPSVKAQMTAYNCALDSWAERIYELRIHPYQDKGLYSWEFTQLDFDLINLMKAIRAFHRQQGFLEGQKELLKTISYLRYELL